MLCVLIVPMSATTAATICHQCDVGTKLLILATAITNTITYLTASVVKMLITTVMSKYNAPEKSVNSRKLYKTAFNKLVFRLASCLM